MRTKALKDKIIVKGNLCEEMCKKGPNMRINDKIYNNIDPTALIDILEHHLKKSAE